jgi:hypothetical protein
VYVRQHLVSRPSPRVNNGRKLESCDMTSEMKASYDAGQYAGYSEFVPRLTPTLDIGRKSQSEMKSSYRAPSREEYKVPDCQK